MSALMPLTDLGPLGTHHLPVFADILKRDR
jgi:hypothetical protein